MSGAHVMTFSTVTARIQLGRRLCALVKSFISSTSRVKMDGLKSTLQATTMETKEGTLQATTMETKESKTVMLGRSAAKRSCSVKVEHINGRA
eukprot:435665-Pleurochrysis_carterae.AAC.2